jgi:hypothetical protein
MRVRSGVIECQKDQRGYPGQCFRGKVFYKTWQIHHPEKIKPSISFEGFLSSSKVKFSF